MKLFFSPNACSLAPHIVLREAGVPFTLEKVDTAKHLTANGTDYYTINPKGQVPLLELDDGQRLSEGAVIAQYVADKANATTLIPTAGSLARYRVMEWQNYVATELHKAFAPLFNASLDASAKAILVGVLRTKFEWVDAALSDSSYLTGNEFTVADAYLFTVSRWSGYVGLDLSDLRHLQRFLKQVGERPAVQEALRAEAA